MHIDDKFKTIEELGEVWEQVVHTLTNYAGYTHEVLDWLAGEIGISFED